VLLSLFVTVDEQNASVPLLAHALAKSSLHRAIRMEEDFAVRNMQDDQVTVSATTLEVFRLIF